MNRSALVATAGRRRATPVDPGLGTALPARMPESSYIGEPPGGAHTITVPLNGNLSNAIAAADPGWVIYLRGGDWYNVGGNVSGALGRWAILDQWNYGEAVASQNVNPITITSYPGEQAVIKGGAYVSSNSTTQKQAVWRLDECSGFRLRNLTFAAPYAPQMLAMIHCWHMEVDRCTFHDCSRLMPCTGTVVDPNGPICGWGIVWSVQCGPVTYRNHNSAGNIQCWNSTFYNNGGNTWETDGDIKHGHSLYWGSTNGSSTAGGGLNGFVVANNLFFDMPVGNHNQFGECARDGFIVNNTFDNCDTRALRNGGCYGDGTGLILWSSGSPPQAYRTQRVKVANNIITNMVGGAFVSTYGNSDTYAQIEFFNNVGTHNAYAKCPGASHYEIQTGTGYYDFGTATYQIHTYHYHDNTVGAPGYRDGTGTWGVAAERDFSLAPGALALGKADPAYAPAFDIRGVARPAAPAAGAYES